MTTRWIRVSLPYATYGVKVDDHDRIVAAAPIAHWMVGKHWSDVEVWLRGKGARWSRVEDET